MQTLDTNIQLKFETILKTYFLTRDCNVKGCNSDALMTAFANNYDRNHVCFIDKTRALQEHRLAREICPRNVQRRETILRFPWTVNARIKPCINLPFAAITRGAFLYYHTRRKTFAGANILHFLPISTSMQMSTDFFPCISSSHLIHDLLAKKRYIATIVIYIYNCNL